MTSDLLLDLGRDALIMTLLLMAPLLVVALVVGMLVAAVQAATQLQEHALAFVPKVVAVFVALVVLGPWLLGRMVEYTRHLITEIPKTM